MLDRPDSEVVRLWLKQALDTKDSAGKRAVLAQLCGVKPQAVSGWLRTGRITKKNLEIAADFFGHGPSFVRSGGRVRELPSPAYAAAWPFARLDLALVGKLARDDLLRLEGAWILAAQQLGFSLAKRRAA